MGLVSLFLLSAAPPAWSATTELPGRAPAVVARLIDEGGAVDTVREGRISSRWDWLPGPPDVRKSPLDPPDPRRSPGFPVVVARFDTRAIPAGWTFKQARPSGAVLLALEKAGSADPRLRTVSAGLRAELGVLDLVFTEGQVEHRMTLILSTGVIAPTVIVHKSCKDFAVRTVTAEPQASRHLFVSVACTRDDDAIYLHLGRSDDAQWSYAPGSEKKAPDTTGDSFVYRIYRETPRLMDLKDIFDVRTRDADGRLLSLEVRCRPGAESCRRRPVWEQSL